jgi:hypothetical protein
MIQNTPNAQGDQAGAKTICLVRCGARDAGAALGLRKGDVLVGVDGVAWQGTVTALKARFAAADAPLALTFRRGGAALTLLAQRADLGLWQVVPADPGETPLPAHVDRLCNWDVMQHPCGLHDLVALRPSLLALMAPPVWLAQMRLWTLLTTLCAAAAIALPVGLPLVGFIWLAAGLHFWRAGEGHLRVARLAEGYRKVGVVAAASETEARAAWVALTPDARFRFDPPARKSGHVDTQPAAI